MSKEVPVLIKRRREPGRYDVFVIMLVLIALIAGYFPAQVTTVCTFVRAWMFP